MRYFIAYTLQGPAATYHEKLAADISARFGTQNPNLRSPAHFTLKAPFETDYIKPFEEFLEAFANKQQASALTLDHFGHFKKHSIYLGAEPSPAAHKTIDAFVSEWASRFGLNGSTDLNRADSLHASIARWLTAEYFGAVWKYVESLPSPSFEIDFDSIALLKYNGERWVVEKHFPFA